jgi:glycosyltransferase involved in cell wall biosynthesis
MLSLVVPAYNEGEHIFSNLMTIASVLSGAGFDYEIIPVNDGSSDNTDEEIQRAATENARIKPVSYSDNRGKGGAIKAGVEVSGGDIIGFLDADLDISPDHIPVYMKTMESTGTDVVIGSKMHDESKLEYPLARKVFSWCYYIMLKVLFGLKTRDTQTGIKFYRGDLIKRIVPKLKVKGYAFDIEILALAARMGAGITEMPVTVNYTREQSFGRIRVGDIIRMFTDTITLWWNMRIRKLYDR